MQYNLGSYFKACHHMTDRNCTCTQKLTIDLQDKPDMIPIDLPQEYPKGYNSQSGTTLCLVTNKLPFIQGTLWQAFVSENNCFFYLFSFHTCVSNFLLFHVSICYQDLSSYYSTLETNSQHTSFHDSLSPSWSSQQRALGMLERSVGISVERSGGASLIERHEFCKNAPLYRGSCRQMGLVGRKTCCDYCKR